MPAGWSRMGTQPACAANMFRPAGWSSRYGAHSSGHLGNSACRRLSFHSKSCSALISLSAGGPEALQAQGFSHYLSATGPSTVHLYGTQPPPGWLAKLPLKEKFRFHRSQVLFKTLASAEGLQAGTLRHVPGHSEWPLTMSTPERALLELLDDLPRQQSFHHGE